MTIFILVAGLFIILFGCILFTNAVEQLGEKLDWGEGVVGSILSAVGTCLPETIIPVLAIITYYNNARQGTEVETAIGAIIGAPFMLSTLAFFLTGSAVLFFIKRRKTGVDLQVNHIIVKRDLKFFITIYSFSGIMAIICRYTQIPGSFRTLIGAGLVGAYALYILITLKAEKHVGTNKVAPLYFSKLIPFNNLMVILLQLLFSLSIVIVGANIFIESIGALSIMMGINASILAIIIAPIATELPEKFNSIIWIAEKKDTLALGNISGAMVFQGCIPVAIGLLFTEWKLDDISIIGIILALVSAVVLYSKIKSRKKLTAWDLMFCVVFYVFYIAVLTFLGVFHK